jgi:hypothetical protein
MGIVIEVNDCASLHERARWPHDSKPPSRKLVVFSIYLSASDVIMRIACASVGGWTVV